MHYACLILAFAFGVAACVAPAFADMFHGVDITPRFSPNMPLVAVITNLSKLPVRLQRASLSMPGGQGQPHCQVAVKSDVIVNPTDTAEVKIADHNEVRDCFTRANQPLPQPLEQISVISDQALNTMRLHEPASPSASDRVLEM